MKDGFMGYFQPNMHLKKKKKKRVTGALHTSVSVVVLADVLSKAAFSR